MRIDNIFRNEDGWFIIVIWDTWMNNLKVEILFHLAFRWSIMQLGLWPTLIFSMSLYFLVCYFDVIRPQRLYDTCALMKYGPHVCSSASFLILLEDLPYGFLWFECIWLIGIINLAYSWFPGILILARWFSFCAWPCRNDDRLL
jgi:hypothetical protein